MPTADPGLTFLPITESAAHAILAWRYDEPYALYDLTDEALPILLESSNRYFAAYEAEGSLVGFCCFGAEAQVPGGDYAGANLLDVGIGMRPDLTGRGLGPSFMTAVLRLAGRQGWQHGFRVTIAAFNGRSRRMHERLGFRETARFRREGRPNGMEFVILTRGP
jgi:RimJ/RimL family protein N-acetyltransferase